MSKRFYRVVKRNRYPLFLKNNHTVWTTVRDINELQWPFEATRQTLSPDRECDKITFHYKRLSITCFSLCQVFTCISNQNINHIKSCSWITKIWWWTLLMNWVKFWIFWDIFWRKMSLIVLKENRRDCFIGKSQILTKWSITMQSKKLFWRL